MSGENALRGERLVSVCEAPDESTATLLCDFLRDQGVEASARAIQMPWFGTIETARRGFWGHVEVLEHDAASARQLVEDFFAARPEPDGPPRGGEDA